MTITNLRQISAAPYKTKQQIAKEYDLSPSTVQNRMKEIEQEEARYGKRAIIRDGGIVLVNYLVFLDYLANRARLKDKNARKYVSPYQPAELARELGWYADED